MNIQNIRSLTKTLIASGFEMGIGQKLVRRICFKPSEFSLVERLERSGDLLTCTIYFERKEEDYTCNYYDAALLKSLEIPDLTFQSINLLELDRRMADIDWEFNNEEAGNSNLTDESGWQEETKIEKVVTDLLRLSSITEGKYYADLLKVKYWSGNMPFGDNLQALRSKFEVTQRFYFYDGQGISVEEAYRFLLNRWLEKKLHSRKKTETGSSNEDETTGTANSGESLLRKNKKKSAKTLKR